MNSLPFSEVENLSLIKDLNDPPSNVPYKLYTNQNSKSTCTGDLFRPFASKGLHFIHCNARSLLPKISELQSIITRTKTAVMCITETWLDESMTNSEVQIDG